MFIFLPLDVSALQGRRNGSGATLILLSAGYFDYAFITELVFVTVAHWEGV